MREKGEHWTAYDPVWWFELWSCRHVPSINNRSVTALLPYHVLPPSPHTAERATMMSSHLSKGAQLHLTLACCRALNSDKALAKLSGRGWAIHACSRMPCTLIRLSFRGWGRHSVCGGEGGGDTGRGRKEAHQVYNVLHLAVRSSPAGPFWSS